MDNFMYDTTTIDCGLGLNSFNPFSTGFPTPVQMNEALSNLDSNIDVSGFSLEEWKQYDPYNLDIRNPYVGGYPTLGGDWNPIFDYDPYAPHIIENMKVLSETNAMRTPETFGIETPTPNSVMSMMDMNEDFISAGMFPNMPSPEMAHALGLISDKDYAFLEMIGPKHDTPSYSHSEPVEQYPAVGPSKSEWEEFDKHEAARAEAVEKYNDCIKNGNLEEASKWADKAVDEQYAKEVIYSVSYVSDINQRAGLY